MLPKNSTKTKTNAVLLAIFFGFGTWFYTYKKDVKKFWLACVFSLVLIIILFFEIVSILKLLLGWLSPENLLDYNNADLIQAIKDEWLPLLIIKLGGLGLWLWPIIDSIRRPNTWYKEY